MLDSWHRLHWKTWPNEEQKLICGGEERNQYNQYRLRYFSRELTLKVERRSHIGSRRITSDERSTKRQKAKEGKRHQRQQLYTLRALACSCKGTKYMYLPFKGQDSCHSKVPDRYEPTSSLCLVDWCHATQKCPISIQERREDKYKVCTYILCHMHGRSHKQR